MEVKVRFRFNKVTGEVEEFIIDDVDSQLPEAEHNREHDRITAEISSVIDRNPRISEVADLTPRTPPETNIHEPVDDEPATTTETRRGGQTE